MKSVYSRSESAPYSEISSSGPITLPFDFDIFVPPSWIQPFVKKLWNGSRKPTRPRSFSAFMKKRA